MFSYLYHWQQTNKSSFKPLLFIRFTARILDLPVVWKDTTSSCVWLCKDTNTSQKRPLCSSTHGAYQWSHPGWGKWRPAHWQSGAPLSPKVLRRSSEGHLTSGHGHAPLQTTLEWGEGEDTKWERESISSRHIASSFLLLTIDDLLPLGLLLAETGQGFRGGQLPPVGRVLLKLQESRVHLLQLWGGAGGGLAGPFSSQNWSFKTEEQRKRGD